MSSSDLLILGGGQLALMLLEASVKLGIQARVHSKSEKDSAALLAKKISAPWSSDLITSFKNASVVVFENEFHDMKTLSKAKVTSGNRDLRFFPSLSSIQILQDKLTQKKLFEKLGLPSADFMELKSAELAFKRFPEGAVLKRARNGYDGKGVFPLLKQDQIKKADEFIASVAPDPVYAEKWIPFQCEVASLFVAKDGKLIHSFPLVFSEQENGICRVVRGPAELLSAPTSWKEETQAIGAKIAKETELSGCFAIEFFGTKNQKLIINEVAPRVHNSAHYSIESLPCSQFEAHIRAAMDLPLPKVNAPVELFAMWNLLGSKPDLNRPLPKNVTLHWYGKVDARPGRKMGHLTATGLKSPKELDSKIQEMKEWEK